MARLKMRLLSMLSFFCLSGCKPANHLQSNRSEAALHVIGGQEARPLQFPATLFIPGCSAAKIGARHILTAAHCILDDHGQLERAYEPGQTFTVYYGVKLATAQQMKVEVVQAVAHPQFVKEIANGGRHFENYADVAVIRVKSLPDHIPSAVIQADGVAGGESIMFTGYGCEELPAHLDVLNSDFGRTLTGYEERYGNHRLKYKEVNVAQRQAIMLVIRNELSADVFVENTAEKRFSGCPGDSGSAAYINDGKTIVGVNSFINPLNSYITRLDRQAGHSVYEWVHQQLSL